MTHDNPPTPIVWVVRGNIENTIAVSPAPLCFGERSKIDGSSRPRTIEISVNRAFATLEFDTNGMPISVVPIGDTSRGSTSRWAVMWSEDRPQPFEGWLTITARSIDGGIAARTEIPVDGGQ
jgi:hypothetical protein